MEFKECPPVFAEYMEYVNNLGFSHEPDYHGLRMMFRELYMTLSIQSPFAAKWNAEKKHQYLSIIFKTLEQETG